MCRAFILVNNQTQAGQRICIEMINNSWGENKY